MGATQKALSVYWLFSKKHKLLVATSFLMLVGNLLLNIIAPLFIALATNRLIKDHDAGGVTKQLIFLGIVSVMGIICDNIGRKALEDLQLEAAYDINRLTLSHTLHMSYDFHVNNFAGSLLSRINKFEQAYWSLCDTLFNEALVFILNTTVSIYILSRYSITIALMFIVLTVVFGYVSIELARQRTVLRNETNRRGTERTGVLADILANSVNIKIFHSENMEVSSYLKSTKKYTDAIRKSTFKLIDNGALNLMVGTVIQISTLAVAVVGIRKGTIPIATIIIVFAYSSKLVDGLFKLSNTIKNLERASTDSREMSEILLKDATVQDRPGSTKLDVQEGALDFTHVAYTYSGNRGALFKDLSLNIQPGQKVGLIGPSGGGKTTLTKLLLRFMDIESGSITLDGQDIAHVTQESLRDAITYVPQEPLLFHRTLADNISYGKRGASLNEIKAAAKKACADEFIDKLPHGYDTLVGERGIKLSGGQRQRIAIARAILKDSPIIVLDEATSALDSESEILIQKALLALMEGRTSIVIAHRLSTVKHLDRILVLENGTITEDGTHEELSAKKDGTYARLWAHQSGGFIE